MSLKTAMSKTGNGILNITTAFAIGTHDGPRKARIYEIDQAIKELKEERRRLVDELIEKL